MEIMGFPLFPLFHLCCLFPLLSPWTILHCSMCKQSSGIISSPLSLLFPGFLFFLLTCYFFSSILFSGYPFPLWVLFHMLLLHLSYCLFISHFVTILILLLSLNLSQTSSSILLFFLSNYFGLCL